MRRSYLRLLEGVLFSLPMLFASCGNGDNALEEIINGGGSGGGTPVTPEEIIYAFSLRNMADDADVVATTLTVKDQDNQTIATATSDGKYTIKKDDLGGALELWLEATTSDNKIYIARATLEELPAIAEAGKLKMATVGDVILSDGKFAAPSSTGTKVAMIAYLGSETGVAGYTHGLALALSDKGSMNWSTATGASGAAAHTPAAPTTTSSWMLPSQDQWNKMIDACKNVLGTKNNYQDLRDGFDSVGGTNLKSGPYWSSTEIEDHPDDAYLFGFDSGGWYWLAKDSDAHSDDSLVRACLAF